MKIKNTQPIKFPLSDTYQIITYTGVVKKGTKNTSLDKSALYSNKLNKELMFFGKLEPTFSAGKLTITEWYKDLEGEFEIALYDRHKEELNYKGYKRYPIFIKDGVWYTLF